MCRGASTACRARSGLTAASPLATLLEYVKEALRNREAAIPRAESLLQTCDIVLESIGELVTDSEVNRTVLMARAHNRRGDALLLLGRPDLALEAFNTALTLTPNDAYVAYNRGMALLNLDRKEEARAEFTKVASTRGKQPGARKLASEALAAMK